MAITLSLNALTAEQVSNALDYFWTDQDIEADMDEEYEEERRQEMARILADEAALFYAPPPATEEDEEEALAAEDAVYLEAGPHLQAHEDGESVVYRSGCGLCEQAIQAKHEQDERDLEAQMLDCGYSVGELRRAFRLVANFENWKLPIDAKVSGTVEHVLRYSIPFMTGSTPTFEELSGGWVRVRADGYYKAVGA